MSLRLSSVLAYRIRLMVSAAAASLALAIFATAAGGAPIVGFFMSDDIGGQFQTGRWTEGFVGGDPDGFGNGAHAGSWDGASLYSDWELTGATLVKTIQYDIIPTPWNTITYYREFDTSAATLTLKAAPWWTGFGDGDYTVALDFYEQAVTVQYLGSTPVSARSSDSFHGTFVGYSGHQLTGQADTAYVSTGSGSPPAGYPAWEPGTVTSGGWGDVGLVRFSVTPEPASLALVGLGLLWMVRFRRR